jgi:hypothetical protein
VRFWVPVVKYDTLVAALGCVQGQLAVAKVPARGAFDKLCCLSGTVFQVQL